MKILGQIQAFLFNVVSYLLLREVINRKPFFQSPANLCAADMLRVRDVNEGGVFVEEINILELLISLLYIFTSSAHNNEAVLSNDLLDFF